MNKDMRILGTGDKLLQAWGGTTSILNKPVTEIFKLRRPKGISFTWGNVRLAKRRCTLKAIINFLKYYFQTYNIKHKLQHKKYIYNIYFFR